MTASSSDNLLVGRDAETAIIAEAVESLSSKKGQLLLLSGEPGIGKSTLARFAADSASSRGTKAYWGFAWEVGGAPSYWPWTQLLRSITSDFDAPPDLLGKLGQLLPEAATDDAPKLQPEQARFVLMESVRLLLEYIGRTTPVVLVLEDIHAADSDSLELLRYIGRHITTLPILIIGTYRDVEARQHTDAESLWLATRDARVLKLARLSEADVRSYVETKKERAIDEAQVKQLLATTDGNPLFLSELCNLLQSGENEDLGELRLPKSVQQVIRQQIGLLPQATVELLTQASIQGRAFDPNTVSTLAGIDTEESADVLEPALETGLIRPFEDGSYRFSHALHRDVLYQGLSATNRRQLHRTYADHISEDIASGDEDRWTELAKHLDAAGPEFKKNAIDAWRKAASRALSRLAFDDAAQQLNLALQAFGAGPRYEPRERCALLLECAEATLLAGNTETGQQHCRVAFATARAMEDSGLMSKAALMWGSAFVVAKIDKGLIAALSECLERLPDDDKATRSKVLARLAAAMQPAANPAEPMALAREAIAMARECGDVGVLYHTIRSAISALMDFAPVSERIPLNREFGRLAEQLGDVPGRFRSKLRLMMDASEAGDRQMMIEAIDACDQLARRIDLPHYLWRAASARAMLATIEGRFSQAMRFIEEAQNHADRIDDSESRITLPIQRFAILVEWDSDEVASLTEIQSQLQEAYATDMPEAEFFLAPYITTYTIGNSTQLAQQATSDKVLLDRIFAAGDRFSLGRTGEIAAKAGDLELAERAFEANLAHENTCANLGLMGSTWLGPVACYLGSVAAALGRTDDARRYLLDALRMATEMRAQAYVARIHSDLSKLETDCGDEKQAAIHEGTAARMMKQLQLRAKRGPPPESLDQSEPVAPGDRFVIERQGDVWKIAFDRNTAMVKDSKGLQLLARLTERPNTDIHVLELTGGRSDANDSSAGPILDAEARAQYQQRVSDLKEELEEATELGDVGRADTLENELNFITRELSRAFGLGGRSRPGGSDAERARVNVRRRIKDAIDRIGRQLPDTKQYLENTVKTGTYCKFAPM